MTSQTNPQPSAISAEAVQAIAQEAYIHGFPMVVPYKIPYSYAIDTQSPDYQGSFKQLSCMAQLFTSNTAWCRLLAG